MATMNARIGVAKLRPRRANATTAATAANEWVAPIDTTAICRNGSRQSRVAVAMCRFVIDRHARTRLSAWTRNHDQIALAAMLTISATSAVL